MLEVTDIFWPDRFLLATIRGERSGQVIFAGILTNHSCIIC